MSEPEAPQAATDTAPDSLRALRAAHRARVQAETRPGETFQQAGARLLREEQAAQAKARPVASGELFGDLAPPSTGPETNPERVNEVSDPEDPNPPKRTRGRQSVRRLPSNDSQRDFLIPALYDVGTRDSRSVMDVAVFRLSKKERRAGEVITYELPDGTVKVSAGPAGMASVWDYDLVLMAISHLTEAMNRYREGKGELPGRVFRPHIADVMKFLRRGRGGKQKADLLESCKRLNTTHLAIQRTRRKGNGKLVTVSEGEALISRYRIVTNTATQAPEHLEIEVAQWMYQEVTEGQHPDVLTVHPDYFLIEPGIGRFLYRLARRAAGRTQAQWSFETIYSRSGSTGTLKKFTEGLRKIIEANGLPEYDLCEKPGQGGPQLVMTFRAVSESLGAETQPLPVRAP